MCMFLQQLRKIIHLRFKQHMLQHTICMSLPLFLGDLFFLTAGDLESFHKFDIKNMPKVMSNKSYAIDWRNPTTKLMYRFHSCNCNNCMGDFSECQCINFVGSWESVHFENCTTPTSKNSAASQTEHVTSATVSIGCP